MSGCDVWDILQVILNKERPTRSTGTRFHQLVSTVEIFAVRYFTCSLLDDSCLCTTTLRTSSYVLSLNDLRTEVDRAMFYMKRSIE